MIKTQNLVFKYTNVSDESSSVDESVLNNININIEKGSFVAVLGSNGSGKSTLAKHFNAILLPTSGSVIVNGIQTDDTERIFDVRKSAGMVFQNPENQMVSSIVEDEIAFAPENLGVDPMEIRILVDNSLKAVGMSKYIHNSPDSLSGGQKQRVAIASVLAMNPECIILDESTAMLDPQGRREVLDTIHKLNKENGITIILITHFMEEAAEADRIIILDNGSVSMDGTPHDIFSNRSKLIDLGLEVPQVCELAYILNSAGINIPTNIISIDECVNELIKLLGGVNS